VSSRARTARVTAPIESDLPLAPYFPRPRGPSGTGPYGRPRHARLARDAPRLSAVEEIWVASRSCHKLAGVPAAGI
jgi:hypothetical protein